MWHRVLLLGLVLSSTTGQLACTHDLVIRRGKLNEPALRAVEEKTAHKRHLPLQKPVPVHVYTKKESGEFFAGTAQSNPAVVEERRRRQDVVAHRLGLLSPQLRVASLFSKALTQNAAGVYRPSQQTLFVVTDVLPGVMRVPMLGLSLLTGVDWNHEHILSHELVHGLQDQHFGLDTLLPSSAYRDNEDQALALKSVLESEANMVANAVTMNVDLDHPVPRTLLLSYLMLLSDLNVWLTRLNAPYLPGFYAKMFAEQYTIGLPYLLHVTDDNGLAGLDASYRDGLLLSTEQLLHPEKLSGDRLDVPAIPTSLRTDDGALTPTFTDANAPSFMVLEENVFGEFLWRVLLEEHHNRFAASAAAAGWDGDRYTVYEELIHVEGSPTDHADASAKQEATADKERGPAPLQRSVLVWRVLLDDVDEAIEFADALRPYLQAQAGAYAGPQPLRNHAFVLDGVDSAVGWDVDVGLPVDDRAELHQQPQECFAAARQGAFVVLVEGAHPRRCEDWLRFALRHNDTDDVAPRRAKAPTMTAGSMVDDGVANVPPPPSPAAVRLHMPHRHASYHLRMGATFGNAQAAYTSLLRQQSLTPWNHLTLFPTGNIHMRVGVRQHLTYALPLTLSLDVGSALASKGQTQLRHANWQTIITGGLRSLDVVQPRGRADWLLMARPAFAVTQRNTVAPGFSVALQLNAEATVLTDPQLRAPADVQVTAGVLLDPLAWAPRAWGLPAGALLLHPSMGAHATLSDSRPWTASDVAPLLVLGSAFTQEFTPLPLVEWVVFPGLSVTGTLQLWLQPTGQVVYGLATAGLLFRL